MESKTKHQKPGRSGDPRMNRAVAARLRNPDISLFDALRAGGFSWSFDDSSEPGQHFFDSDGVSLSQRKNQLNRRLRQLKKKAGQTDFGGDHDLNIQQQPSPGTQQDQVFETVFGSHVEQEPHIPPPQTYSESFSTTNEDSQHHVYKNPCQKILSPSALTVEQEGHFRSFSPLIAVSEKNISIKEKTTKSMITMQSPLSYSEDMPVSATGQTSSFSSKSAPDVPAMNNQSGQRLEKEEDFSESCTFSSSISSNVDEEDRKMKVAIDLFHTKNAILLKKSLLMAGFSAEENIESSATYQEFARNAMEEALGKL